MVITDEKKIDELLSRGVEDIIVKEDLKKALLSGKVLRVKFGIDPTGPKIHLGRAATLRKLKAFQDLGHKIVLIVGDFTARIGDASDKLEKRPMLTDSQIKENLKNYKKQLGLIIDLKKAEFHFNSKWLKKLGFLEISELAESFSVNQMSSRRNFKERFERGDEVSLREFMYPLMQGYDSVAVKADVEIGGFDQLFNLKAGRIVQKHYKMPEQNILTGVMIEGTDGRKMSTSWGNVITIVDEPNDMFGKLMSLNDSLIIKYFIMCTDLSLSEINNFENELKNGVNPKDIKMKLAFEITKMYHNQKKAKDAQEDWIKKFQNREIPDELTKVKKESGKNLMEMLVVNKIIVSNGAFRRLVEEGAIMNLETKERISDNFFIPELGQKFKIGKKIFIEIV